MEKVSTLTHKLVCRFILATAAHRFTSLIAWVRRAHHPSQSYIRSRARTLYINIFVFHRNFEIHPIAQMTIMHGRRLFLPSHNFSRVFFSFYKLAARPRHTHHPWLRDRIGRRFQIIHTRENEVTKFINKRPNSPLGHGHRHKSPDGIREQTSNRRAQHCFLCWLNFRVGAVFSLSLSASLLSSEAYKSETRLFFYCVDVVRNWPHSPLH